MKRLLSVFLSLLLLPVLSTAASAYEGDAGLRTSSYCDSASMSDYRTLFHEAESSGALSYMTRGMLAGILYRVYGEAGETAEYPADVDSSAWYADGAAWAVQKNLITAYADGSFDPDGALTREAFLVTLYRCMNAYGVELEAINAWYSFLDGGLMSSEAQTAAYTLQRAGVMIEDTDGFFHYSDNVTVAEGEEILLRFLGSHKDVLTALPVSSVVESEPVGDEWFDDACFIGHSQIVGMQKYSGIANADYYAVVGHTAQNVVDYEYYELPNGGYGTLSDGLHANSYGKVYIMLGINDSSLRENRDEEFMSPMRQIISLVQETQPDAKIYLLSLTPVGRYTSMNELYNPDSTVHYSQLVKTLSREFSTEYIDLFRMMCDSAGYYLDSFNSGDGIHIASERYPEIVNYLKSHT